MLSLTGTYALQAALHLALHRPGEAVSAAVMASQLEIPASYLAKVLRRLAREGVLKSSRGPGGGFHLARAPEQLTVAVVVAPFQALRPARLCLMGGECDLTDPCSAHARRAAWNAAALEILEQTTLADLLSGEPLGDPVRRSSELARSGP